MIPFSKSPSRIPGRPGVLRTVPVAGSAALIAAPSAWVTLTVGIVSGAATKLPLMRRRRRRRRRGVVLSARMTALAPAAWAFCVFTLERGSVPPVDHGAIAPAGKPTSAVAALGRRARCPSFTRTIWPADAGVRGRRPVPRPAGAEVADAVDDDLVLEPERRDAPRPEEHLHPRHAGAGRRLGRRREVGVVRPRAVLSLAADVVAAEAAAAVVVRLEVPCCLVEAEAVEDVVERVAAVEQVRDNGVAVELRVLRQVGGEVEVEPRTAARAATEVLRLVVVLV